MNVTTLEVNVTTSPSPPNETKGHVVVPDITDCLSADQLSSLKSLVNSLTLCDNHGKIFYVATTQLVMEILDQ